ncbi:hypothetical protein [Krasilnikovia sp. MM14-A1259]|uniref:hypothetical protein n=1 Tax=Krasilnikovia sp. MM14-A1259 TaxID=3373539 RepID=UPI0038121B4C
MSNVATSKKFRISALVQFLATPNEYVSGPHLQRLGHGVGAAIWEVPTTEAETEETMNDVAGLTRDKAIPYFDQVGTLSTFAADAQARAAEEPSNMHYQEALFAVRLITGDVPGALLTAAEVRSALTTTDEPWKIVLKARVAEVADAARQDPDRAVDVLRTYADHTLTALRLPKAK